MKKRRRIVGILLFPVLSIVFVVGWLLFFVGGTRKKGRNVPQKKTSAPQEQSNLTEEDPIEVGLMEQLAEEPLARST